VELDAVVGTGATGSTCRRFKLRCASELPIGLTQMMVEGELIQLERIGRIGVTEADA
jgi:hypothetical protein